MKKTTIWLFTIAVTISLILSGCAQAETEEDVITIGLQAPLTGDFAAEGLWARQCVEVAAELINQNGGVLGRTVAIEVVDDGSNPRDSALAAQKAIAQGLQHVIASYGSSVTAPAADLYDENGVISVAYGATAVRLTMEKERPYFFRTSGRDDTQSEYFVKFVVEDLNAKRIAIMHDNQDYGKGVADDAMFYLQPYIDAGEVEVVYFDAITPGESDYSAVISQIRSIDPDVWFFTAYYSEAALLIKQAREAGVTSLFVGNNAVPTPEFENIAGIDAIAGSIHLNEPMPQFLDYPESQEFLDAYQAKHNELPGSIWAVYAADALNAIVAAIERADSTDPDDVAAVMRTMTDARGITGPLMFTDRGDRRDIPYYAYIYNDQGVLELYEK
ncbi:MAG: branched-chain amino acid ABC transporter substrate-binding protein [Anaerolineales bacterium]